MLRRIGVAVPIHGCRLAPGVEGWALRRRSQLPAGSPDGWVHRDGVGGCDGSWRSEPGWLRSCLDGLVARLARTHLQRCRELTAQIRELDRELEPLVTRLAPTLVALCGCATLTAAKIIGETAGVERFHSRHAFARHNGTAPVPVWSSNRRRSRLSRTGNRQLNAALHRIAITQAHYQPQARELLKRRRATGDTKTESIRVLKRRLSDVVYRALLADVDRADTLTKATVAAACLT